MCSSHYKKKKTLRLCAVMDVNQTNCDDHFPIFTYTKSLCCKPKTRTMLYVNYNAMRIEKNMLTIVNLIVQYKCQAIKRGM